MPHIFVGHVFNREQIDDLRPAIIAGVPIAGGGIWFADEHPGTGQLFEKIAAGIDASFACIFEVTDTTRANVFLELGFALAKEKRCVLICRKGTNVPVDLAGFERLEYESYADLTRQLEATIGRRLRGRPISKGVVLALQANPKNISRSGLEQAAQSLGADLADVSTDLIALSEMGIVSVTDDQVAVLEPETISAWASVAR